MDQKSQKTIESCGLIFKPAAADLMAILKTKVFNVGRNPFKTMKVVQTMIMPLYKQSMTDFLMPLSETVWIEDFQKLIEPEIAERAEAMRLFLGDEDGVLKCALLLENYVTSKPRVVEHA